jgi:hypothetical protein
VDLVGVRFLRLVKAGGFTGLQDRAGIAQRG